VVDDSARVATRSPMRALGARKLVPIAGAALVLLVVVIVLAGRGGGSADPPPQTAASAHVEGSASPAVEPPVAVAEPAAAPVAEPAVEPPVAEPPPEPAPAPVAAVAPAPVRRRPNTLGGKQVVLEYDTPARETPKTVARNDAAAIGAARISYSSGNHRLFKGDADGAIRNYRQALAIYPGYVAGYRGLGLAYAQKGDTANALKALRTYVRAVPNAKDAALIKKRIAILQKR